MTLFLELPDCSALPVNLMYGSVERPCYRRKSSVSIRELKLLFSYWSFPLQLHVSFFSSSLAVKKGAAGPDIIITVIWVLMEGSHREIYVMTLLIFVLPKIWYGKENLLIQMVHWVKALSLLLSLSFSWSTSREIKERYLCAIGYAERGSFWAPLLAKVMLVTDCCCQLRLGSLSIH